MIRQIGVLFGFLFLGEAISTLTGIKIPGSIIGMLLLTLSLKLGLIKLNWVKGIADILIGNIGFLFVPAGVSVMLYSNLIKPALLPITLAMIGSTVIVLITTGHIHQFLRKWF